MKKIIILSKNLNIGGMEKSLITLANKIDFEEYEVTIVLEKLEGELYKKLNKKIKVIDYNLSNNKNIFIRKLINAYKKIKFLIKNYHRYDCAINYATYSIFGSKMAVLSSKNSLLFIHSDYYNVYDRNIDEIKKFFKSICIEKFNKVIFVSRYSMEKAIEVMPVIKNKATLLGNLVDYEEILKQSNEYTASFNKEKVNIVYVGRLDESSKQISKLIKAVNDGKNKEQYNLYIIGKGPDEEQYKEMTKAQNIYFMGEKENPYPYIKEADYLILTSKYEGFPVVYNEATILNTKIITTIKVEDEQIVYDDKNIILLDKELNNFNDVIQRIIKNENTKIDKINFEKINKKKIEEFYKLVNNE